MATRTAEPFTTTSWEELADLVEPHASYRIHRAGNMFWNGHRTHLHTHHGFVELFWIEAGRAVYELNGSDHTVRQGDLLFVQEADVHRYRGPSDDFTIMNLAFPTSNLGLIGERWMEGGSTPWDLPEPRRLTPPPHHWARLLELAAALGHGRQTQLRLDHFLLEILLILEGPLRAEHPMPQWLVDAINQWCASPEAMHAGVRGLADIANRSREHVSRVVRESTGTRAVDVINSLRMESAAGQLRMSDTPIGQIAAEVGLPNLSHFYDVFRKQFGTTPRQYRISQRRTVDPMVGGQ